MASDAPLHRRTCQWCGSAKHAQQYTGARIVTQKDGTREITFDRTGSCWICPRCDSPSVVAPAE